MKIFLKYQYSDTKLFERIATRLGLYQVFSPSSKNVLIEIDDGFEVNDDRLVYYTFYSEHLRDLIEMSAKLQIKLLLINEKNDSTMSKDLFFQMRQDAHLDDIHEFETNQSVPAWIAEGFDSRQAWEQDNQHDADAETQDDLDETHKYFNL